MSSFFPNGGLHVGLWGLAVVAVAETGIKKEDTQHLKEKTHTPNMSDGRRIADGYSRTAPAK